VDALTVARSLARRHHMAQVPRSRLIRLRQFYTLVPDPIPNLSDIAELVRPLYENVLHELDALLEQYEGDVPIEAVNTLASQLQLQGYTASHLADDNRFEDVGAFEKLSAMYAEEISVGAARALGMLLENE